MSISILILDSHALVFLDPACSLMMRTSWKLYQSRKRLIPLLQKLSSLELGRDLPPLGVTLLRHSASVSARSTWSPIRLFPRQREPIPLRRASLVSVRVTCSPLTSWSYVPS